MTEHRLMSWWRSGVVAVALLAACTKPNPQSCQDGTCTDPALPFCDLDGALAGEAETCIPVACTANEFVACRGDRAITCNTTGTDYDLVQCERGCTEAASGCRLCEQNETICTNGKTQTCDANGAVVSSEVCALGCFEDQPRCRDVDPSNGLATYVDMVASPSDLDLDGAVIYTESGEILEGDVPVAGVPTFLATPAVGGVPIRVVVVRNLRLADVHIFSRASERTGVLAWTGPAIAFVATGTITVAGRLVASGGAGGSVVPSCVGGNSAPAERDCVPGGGGGGHATAGAVGGNACEAGGTAGAFSGTESLSPLRGGCPGGGRDGFMGSPGGGAVQLTSRRSIEVLATIDVRGESIGDPAAPYFVTGGGAGGAILIEAPKVTLGVGANLIAIGGAGGSGYANGYVPPPPMDDGLARAGTPCTTVSNLCGAGGAGAAPGSPATPGTNTNQPLATAGGGGGGLGRARINTPDRTYSKVNTVVEGAATTVGTLATR